MTPWLLPLRDRMPPFCWWAVALCFSLGTGAHCNLRAAETEPVGKVVELPPLEVVQSSEQPWSFCELPGFRVLSQCPADITQQFIWDYARYYHLLGAVLPKTFITTFDVPEKLLLYNRTHPSAATQRIAWELSAQLAAVAPPEGDPGMVRIIPNLNVRDRDSAVFFALLDPETMITKSLIFVEHRSVKSNVLYFLPDDLRPLLESRVPRLPDWFLNGFMELYATMTFDHEAAIVGPMNWISPEETRKLKMRVPGTFTLRSLHEVFSRPTEIQDPVTAAFFRAEAALFIRWCLESKTAGSKPALWSFLADTGQREPSEADFLAHFHLSTAKAAEQMAAYLPNAVRRSFEVKPATKFKTLKITTRLATAAEIAEMKGDWQRLELGFVKDRLPQFAPKYAEQAQRTLLDAYQAGERSPELEAEIALYECDRGNFTEARKFLETAAAARVVHPRIYVELARLRLNEALPFGGPTQLDEPAAEAILALLNRGRAQSPPQLETYALLCRCFAGRGKALDPAELKILAEGVSLFPHEANLLYATALLELHHGDRAEAQALAERGLAENLTPKARAAFEQLRTSATAQPHD